MTHRPSCVSPGSVLCAVCMPQVTCLTCAQRLHCSRQVYEELDESLTKAFEDFLRERGVDEALGAFLVEAVHDKEQREYQAWLGRVQTFLQAK